MKSYFFFFLAYLTMKLTFFDFFFFALFNPVFVADDNLYYYTREGYT